MVTCTLCLRLRRPNGLHICVPGLRARPQVETPAPEVQTSRRGNLGDFHLPVQWSAAIIWNDTLNRSRTP